MLERVVYVSQAAPRILAGDLYGIIREAHARNPAAGISGGLVFLHGWFAQVLEGSGPAVRTIWNAILADPRHAGVTLRARERALCRLFSGQAMALRTGACLDPRLLEAFRLSSRFSGGDLPRRRAARVPGPRLPIGAGRRRPDPERPEPKRPEPKRRAHLGGVGNRRRPAAGRAHRRALIDWRSPTRRPSFRLGRGRTARGESLLVLQVSGRARAGSRPGRRGWAAQGWTEGELAEQPVGDPEGVGGDGQARVDPGRGRHERRIGDIEVLQAVGAAGGVEHARRGIGAEAQRAARMPEVQLGREIEKKQRCPRIAALSRRRKTRCRAMSSGARAYSILSRSGSPSSRTTRLLG